MANEVAKLSDLMDPVEFECLESFFGFDRLTARTVLIDRSIMSAVEEGDEESLTDLPDWQKEQVEIARAIVNPGSLAKDSAKNKIKSVSGKSAKILRRKVFSFCFC